MTAPFGRIDGEETEVNEPRIKLVPFNDLKLGTARRWLIKELFPSVGLVIVWGPPKSGKSFLVFDALLHVALGWEYRGRRVNQGPVVYCCFEGQAGIEARAEAFRKRQLKDNHLQVPLYLQLLTLDLVNECDELIAAIRAALGRNPPKAVVLDTLNRSLRGSESSDQDMSAYIKAADAIREAFECAVIVVHHCGVNETRPRGHTSLTGAADAQISVKRNGADQIVAEVEFAKDGPTGDQIVSRLEPIVVGQDEDNQEISSCVVVP